jgi:hypothetical protein
MKTTLKQYSEWLFEDHNDIIYEKGNVLSESAIDRLLDAGQIILAGVGALPIVGSTVGKFADVANGIIYLARREYVFALISFLCAALPPLADNLGESGLLLLQLGRLAEVEGRFIPRIASEIVKRSDTIIKALRAVVPWLREHKDAIKEAIQDAVDAMQQERAEIEAGSSREDLEPVAAPVNEGFVSSAIGGTLGTLTNLLLRNETIRRYLSNPEVVQGLKDAADELFTLLEQAQQAVEDVSEESPDESEPRERLNEGYTDIRFKKLAGIID